MNVFQRRTATAAMVERNAGLPEDRRIVFRTGQSGRDVRRHSSTCSALGNSGKPILGTSDVIACQK
jgi:hypothetical protein